MPVRYYLSQSSLPLAVGEFTCGMYLYVVVHVLRFDCPEQGHEPFKRANVVTDPKEIDLPKKGVLGRVIHSIPDALKN